MSACKTVSLEKKWLLYEQLTALCVKRAVIGSAWKLRACLTTAWLHDSFNSTTESWLHNVPFLCERGRTFIGLIWWHNAVWPQVTEDWGNTYSRQLLTSVFNTFSTELEREETVECHMNGEKYIQIVTKARSLKTEHRMRLDHVQSRNPATVCFVKRSQHQILGTCAKCQVIRLSSCALYIS